MIDQGFVKPKGLRNSRIGPFSEFRTSSART
jgi:hypothetical protein